MYRAALPSKAPDHDRRWLILSAVAVAQLMVVLNQLPHTFHRRFDECLLGTRAQHWPEYLTARGSAYGRA